MAKEPEATPKLPPQAPSPAAQQQAGQDAAAYIGALLSGEAQSPNEFAADLVTQLKDAQAELQQIRDAVPRLMQDLERARARQVALTAIAAQLAGNLVKWKDRTAKLNGD